jgi:hypothetical protein
MAADSKTFTTRFDLLDNFTRKFNEIHKKITSITNSKHVVGLELNTSAAGKSLEGIKKTVSDATSVSNSWNNAMGKAAGIADKTSSATKKIGSETEKSASAMDKMKSKLEGVGSFTDKLKDKFGAITGLLTGGMAAGISWLKASDAKNLTESIYRKMERKRIDTSQLDEFVKGASGLGYTTAGQRLNIADSILGRTRLRGTKAQTATESIEKLFAQDSQYFERKGITSSADLAELLTKKTLSRQEKLLLADVGIKGGSVSSRLRSAEKLSKDINPEDLAKKDPYAAFQNRLGELSSKIGKTMLEPMTMIFDGVNKIFDAINKIPNAPGLIAMGMVLVSAAGGASLLLTAMSPLVGVITAIKAALLSQRAATIAASVATKAAALTQWLLNAAMTANPVGLVIVGIAALIAILYLVEKKTHVFSNALKSLSQSEFGQNIKAFFTSLGDRISGATTWVGKLYEKIKATGLLKFMAAAALGPIGLIGLAATSGDEIKEKIWTSVNGLLNWARSSFPFLSKIHEVMKKVYSIFEWIYSLWQSFWSWIKSAIPGAEKESKRKEMEKRATKEGIYLGTDNKWYALNAKGEKSGISASNAGKPPSQKLLNIYEEWKDLPGFADGIAQAVATGISGIGTVIAEAISKAITDAFPDFSGLTKALGDLVKPLNDFVDKLTTELNPEGEAAGRASTDKLTAAGLRSFIGSDSQGYVEWINPEEHRGEDPEAAANKALGLGHASGLTFTKTGVYKGKFHGPEETLPQATTIKGPGVIARALDLLANVAPGGPISSPAGYGGEIHIHMPAQDFSGMKISSNVDLEKILDKANKKAVDDAVDAVKKAIGQRRT